MPKRLPKFCIEDVDRHGNVRVYFRRKGQKKRRLRGIPWTEEFMEQYKQALKGNQSTTKKNTRQVKKAKLGTWPWLCERYWTECSEYKLLDPAGRQVRKRLLESTFDEPLKPKSETTYFDFPINKMATKALRVLRDRKLPLKGAANNRVKAIRAVFKFAIKNDYLNYNPALDLEKIKTKSEGFHTWTINEVAAYEARHPIGSRAYLALALLLYTGVRRSDVVQLGRQHVRDGWLRFTPKKTSTTTGMTIEIPILPQLAEIIDQSAPSEHLTFLMTEYGKPFTANGFGNYFKDCCRTAGLPHCSAHGLRKAGATIAAENGATEHQLMAIYGWSSLRMAELYTRKANQRKLAAAAMHLIALEQTELKQRPTLSSGNSSVGQNRKKSQQNQ